MPKFGTFKKKKKRIWVREIPTLPRGGHERRGHLLQNGEACAPPNLTRATVFKDGVHSIRVTKSGSRVKQMSMKNLFLKKRKKKEKQLL